VSYARASWLQTATPMSVTCAAGPALLDYYAQVADGQRPDAALHRGTRTITVASSPPAVWLSLANRCKALTWARTERATPDRSLDLPAAAADQAGSSPSRGVSGLLRIDGPWPDAITSQYLRRRAARQTVTNLPKQMTLNDLGACGSSPVTIERPPEALGKRLDIYRESGPNSAKPTPEPTWGWCCWLVGDYPGARPGPWSRRSGILRDRDGQCAANALLPGATQIVTGTPRMRCKAMSGAQNFRVWGGGGSERTRPSLLDLGNARLETGDLPWRSQVIERGAACP